MSPGLVRSALQEQAGRLFRPLAFTKTYSMAAAAIPFVTLSGADGLAYPRQIQNGERNPISRLLILTLPSVVDPVFRWRKT
ncbi:MAG: hypothetical protein R2864_05135 [Syntrophotaleaceae bacterium]